MEILEKYGIYILLSRLLKIKKLCNILFLRINRYFCGIKFCVNMREIRTLSAK